MGFSCLSATRSIYANTPLDDPHTRNRLLRRLSLESSYELLTCKLTDAPPFRAISYTWGDPADTSIIFVNSRSFGVRKNCQYALWQAGLHSGEPHIWIDSICINQDDNAEKGPQVARMGQIYRTATNVLACIGPPDEASEHIFLAVQSLKEFSDRLTSPLRGKALKAVATDLLASWQVDEFEASNSKLVSHFNDFSDRPYFTRPWIIQEIAQPKHTVLFCCGERIVDGMSLARFLTTSRILVNRNMSLKITWLLSIASRSKPLTPSMLIRDVAGYQCKDPRDRIYGTLDLVQWGNDAPRPDYDRSKSKWDLAVDITRRFTDSQTEDSFLLIEPIALVLHAKFESPEVQDWLEKRRTLTPGPISTKSPLSRWLLTVRAAFRIRERQDHQLEARIIPKPRVERPQLNRLLEPVPVIRPGDLDQPHTTGPTEVEFRSSLLSFLVPRTTTAGDIILLTHGNGLSIRPQQDSGGLHVLGLIRPFVKPWQWQVRFKASSCLCPGDLPTPESELNVWLEATAEDVLCLVARERVRWDIDDSELIPVELLPGSLKMWPHVAEVGEGHFTRVMTPSEVLVHQLEDHAYVEEVEEEEPGEEE